MDKIPDFETAPPHVLVVDDEPVFVELVRLWLERADYRVTCAFTGEEALAMLGHEASGPLPAPEPAPPAPPFDLVLLDIMMPGLNGKEVCQRIRAHPPTAQLPVLILSALSSSVERVEALQAGANDYLTKPFIGVELLTRVGNLIRWYRMEQASQEKIRSRNQELQALNEIGATLNQTLRLSDLLHETLNAVCQVAGLAWGAIYLLDPVAQRLDVAAYRDVPPTFLQGQSPGPRDASPGCRDDSLAWQMIERISPVVSPAVRLQTESDGELDAGVYHFVLLAAKGQAVGLMVVGGDGQGELPPEKAQLLGAIGHQIGVAVANASLFERLQHHSHKLSSLNKVMGMMLSRLDLSSVLSVIVEGLVKHWAVAQARLWLLAQGDGQDRLHLVLRASAGLSNDLDERQAQIPLEADSPIARIATRREEKLSTRLDRDLSHLDRDWARREGLQTFAGFPLTYGGRVIGVLALFAREVWGQADFDLLRSFAHQATTAIENARLYAHEQRQVIELKNLAQELERSQAQLVQSAKMAAVGRLAAALAHEINNPLQAIHNCLILSQRFSPGPGEHVEYMRLAGKEVERLIGLVQRMLDFYRPSHSHRTLADVNRLVEGVVEMAQNKLSQSQIDLHLDLAPQLPPVHVISDQISQVILNLMLNAVETLSGGGRLELSSRRVEGENAPRPTWVEVSVRDDGPGLSPEQVKHVFEPFSAYTAQSNGNGLGLAISFGIVERHGGTIQVDSAPGAGTTFRLRLPVETDNGR